MAIDTDEELSAEGTLRRRAEEKLNAREADRGGPRSGDESQRLLHELQVHQIELEMQNAELQRARDEVETALGKYTDLYDFAPVGYLSLDRDGTVRAANLTGASLLGLERSRLLGRRFEQFVAAADRPVFTSFLRWVFESRAKGVCEVALLKAGNGPLSVQIEAVADAAGQECRVAVIDVTERKWIEDKFRRSEHQLAEAQRLVHLGSWQWDPGVDKITGSDEFYRIFGQQFSSYDGFLALVHPDDRDSVNRALQDALHRHTPYNIYYRIVPQGGSTRIIHAEGVAETDGAGKAVRMTGTALDVTDRRELEEKLEILHTDLAARATDLEAANLELEAFNYSVSHDLRTPLTVINSYCQIILELFGNSLGEECRGYIGEMYQGTLRMDRLIDTLLDFSRIKRVAMQPENLNLSRVAEEVARELKASAPDRRVTFRIAEGIEVKGDARLLRTVLDNLMGNAWKYSGTVDEAIIEFDRTAVAGETAFYVRDNGPGFDMAHADRLFVPFQRLAGTGVAGDGIGLATVERIVRRHGGRVWAESEPGKCACFYFTLAAD